MTDLTHDRLRALLNYDPETGVFTRLVDSSNGRYKAGDTTGTSDKRYLFVWIENKPHLAHRVAWFWMTGQWPVNQIDHVSLDKRDNRWANLREATISQNAMNHLGKTKFSLSGAKGVSFVSNEAKRGSKPWKATIQKDGRRRYLGLFHTVEEAGAAYAAAAAELHGDFARVA